VARPRSVKGCAGHCAKRPDPADSLLPAIAPGVGHTIAV
jgi:hypothetical protein